MSLWVNGRIEQRLKHVAKQLLKAGHHVVLTIDVAT